MFWGPMQGPSSAPLRRNGCKPTSPAPPTGCTGIPEHPRKLARGRSGNVRHTARSPADTEAPDAASPVPGSEPALRRMSSQSQEGRRDQRHQGDEVHLTKSPSHTRFSGPERNHRATAPSSIFVSLRPQVLSEPFSALSKRLDRKEGAADGTCPSPRRFSLLTPACPRTPACAPAPQAPTAVPAARTPGTAAAPRRRRAPPPVHPMFMKVPRW